MAEDQSQETRFAPADPTDGRGLGKWKTRYPEKEAQNSIRVEAIYVCILLFICPLLLAFLWIKETNTFWDLSQSQCKTICRYSYSWIGGVLGGTLFTLKWLYHSVARWLWHRDRRLWRFCAPHLSGALAFVFLCMINSGIIVIFDKNATEKPSVIIAISFLVGYFSDSALAKMSEIAMSLFGSTEKHQPKG